MSLSFTLPVWGLFACTRVEVARFEVVKGGCCSKPVSHSHGVMPEVSKLAGWVVFPGQGVCLAGHGERFWVASLRAALRGGAPARGHHQRRETQWSLFAPLSE